MTQQYEQAIHSYRLAIKLNPTSSECHFNLASAFNDNADHKNALIHYKEAMKLDPENVETVMNIADVYECMEDPVDAFNYFQQAKQMAPHNLRADEGLQRVKRILDKHAEEQKKKPKLMMI